MLIDAGADVLVHCGDLTVPEIVYECAESPRLLRLRQQRRRRGRHPRRRSPQSAARAWVGADVVTLGGKRVAVTHGDQRREVAKLAASRPDYLLFGHSHVPTDDRDGPTRWINPGALHRAEEWTVALLNFDTDCPGILEGSLKILSAVRRIGLAVRFSRAFPIIGPDPCLRVSPGRVPRRHFAIGTPSARPSSRRDRSHRDIRRRDTPRPVARRDGCRSLPSFR